MMLGALLLAWRSWTGSDELLLDVEGHGRDVRGDALDVSRTVGWFTTVFPVRLVLPGAPASGPADAVRAVQSTLSAVPLRGASHGMLRWLSPDEHLRRALGTARRPDVLFNYLGARHSHVAPGAPIRMATESPGRARSPDGPRAYVLEVNAYIEDGRVTFDIEYSSRLHRPSTIERLADALRIALREIVPIQAPRFELAALDDAAMSLVADLLSEVDDE
jgi:non-ribosomal peptide synthase protein (TIGR01720 family)